jgi:hypothetical protein
MQMGAIKLPEGVRKWLDWRFHFDLDVCGEESTTLCAKYLARPGRDILKEGPRCAGVDGLRMSWVAPRCFACPMEGDGHLRDWMVRAIDQAEQGVASVVCAPFAEGEELLVEFGEYIDRALVFGTMGWTAFVITPLSVRTPELQCHSEWIVLPIAEARQ